MCIDSPVDGNHMNQPVSMYPCHNQGGNQFWMLSKNGEIRRDEGCLDYAGIERGFDCFEAFFVKGLSLIRVVWTTQVRSVILFILRPFCEAEGFVIDLLMQACPAQH